MTDETTRPATASDAGTGSPVVVGHPATGDQVLSGPGTANPTSVSRPATGEPSAPRTTMTDTVVAKIAGIAASGVPGVHRLGGPLDHLVDRAVDRAVDGFRDGVRRANLDRSPDPDADRGVTVEVGEREAGVTVELTVEFGARVEDVAAGVRREVSAAVERMTDLRVREVDVRVADVHVPAGPPVDGPR